MSAVKWMVVLLAMAAAECTSSAAENAAPHPPPMGTAEKVTAAMEPSTAKPDVTIQNLVEECVEVRFAEHARGLDAEALHVVWETKKILAECGCNSRGLSYRVVDQNEAGRPRAPEIELLRGNFVPRENRGELKLHVSQKSGGVRVPIRFLRIGCQLSE